MESSPSCPCGLGVAHVSISCKAHAGKAKMFRIAFAMPTWAWYTCFCNRRSGRKNAREEKPKMDREYDQSSDDFYALRWEK